MPKLQAIDLSNLPDELIQFVDLLQAGSRLACTMANSPAALKSYAAFAGALSGGVLDARLRELIALTVAAATGCRYCLSLHASAAGSMGLTDDEIRSACHAASADPRVEAALRFVHAIVAYRADLTDGEFDRVVRAGYSEEEIAEIVANVALNLFTNYFTTIARISGDAP